ncbi:hypothetical protein OROMI_026658 [Orobanche minor]
MSCLVGVVCTQQKGQTVLLAAGLTLLVTVGLTMFTFFAAKRGWDFNFLGPFLFCALLLLLAFGICRQLIGIFGALVFSGYIIYDTETKPSLHVSLFVWRTIEKVAGKGKLKISRDLIFKKWLGRDKQSDVDGNELYVELKLFQEFLPPENMGPIDILKFLKGLGFFPNAIIAYRILLTIPVTVASAERSFSKLKLLKSYMRSMSQERLNGLALIAIENDILEQVD